MFRKFFLNSAYSMVFLIIGLPLGYVVRLLLSQQLSMEQFGLFYGIMGFYGILGTFNDFGFSEAQIYFIPKYLNQKAFHKIKAAIFAQFIIQILSTTVTSLIVYVMAHYIAVSVFHIEAAVPILLIMLLYFFSSDLLRNIQALNMAFQDIKIISTLDPIRLFFSLIGLIVLSMTSFGGRFYIIAFGWSLIYLIFTVIYLFLFIRTHIDIFYAKSYSMIKIIKEYFSISIPVLIASSGGVIFSFNNSILLPALKNVSEVALLNIAYPIANILLSLISPIASLLFPFTSQMDDMNNLKYVRSITLTILNAGVFIFLPIVVLFAIYATETVDVLFGVRYLKAGPILNIFSYYIFFVVINKFLANIMVGMGLQKDRIKIIYMTAAINLFLAYFLIREFNAFGSILSAAISELLTLCMLIYLLKKKLAFRLPLINYLKIFILIIGFFLFHNLLRSVSSTYFAQRWSIISIKVITSLSLYYGFGIFGLEIIDKLYIKKLIIQAFSKKNQHVDLMPLRYENN